MAARVYDPPWAPLAVAAAATTKLQIASGIAMSFEPTWAQRSAPLPIWVAALRDRMCELAGECADGLIGHPVWSVDYMLGAGLAAMTEARPAQVEIRIRCTYSCG